MNSLEKKISDSLTTAVENEVPSDKIKQHLFYSKETKTNKSFTTYRRIHMRKFRAGIALTIIAGFIISVNISPVFAEYLGKIPFVAGLVDIVKLDKGMQQIMNKDEGIQKAIESGHGQHANASATANDMTFTVENIVPDQDRMLITYSVKYDKEKYGELKSLWFNNLKVSGDGKILHEFKDGFHTNNAINNDFVSRNIVGPGEQGNSGITVSQNENSDEEKLYGWMEIIKKNENAVFPTTIDFEIDGWKSTFTPDAKQYPGSWKVSFTLQEELLNIEPIVYAGREFNIKTGAYDLDLKVDYTKISPIMTALKLDVMDYKNSPNSFHYNMHLEDETGQVYDHLEDGIMTDSGNVLPEFASCYFTQPKELYLVIESLVDHATEQELPVDIRVKLN